MTGVFPAGFRPERGSATVWTVVITALVWMTALVVVQAGVGRVARHRVQSAADLSALAAASWAFAAPEQACERARKIAAANGTRLESCLLAGGIADVAVSVDLTLLFAGSRTVRAVARAGPVSAPIGLGA